MKFLRLLQAEFRLHMYMVNQYRFEHILFVILYTVIFVGVFHGARSFMGADADAAESLDRLMFGYFMYIFAMLAFNAAPHGVVEGNNRGYIDQMMMAPQGFLKLLWARSLVKIGWGIIQLTAIVIVAMAATGNWIDFDFLAFYGILALTAPSLIGIGFINCGLAHVFKNVNMVNGIVTMSFLFLVALDAWPVNAASFLPFIMGASIAKDVVLDGQPIPFGGLVLVVLNSLAYVGIGIGLYMASERKAKRLNLIGVY